MKYCIFLLVFFLTGRMVWSQPNYPASVPPATNLLKMEYFFDADPGAGNGIPLVISADAEINAINFQVDITGISTGFHRVYFRTCDANGTWSHTHNAFFDNYIVPAYAVAPAPASTITEAEYYIDADPGMGNGVNIPLTPATDVADLAIPVNISGLSAGAHRLFIRTKNTLGQWGLTYVEVFDNSTPFPYPVAPAPAPTLQTMEYFLDTDPGFGNGQEVTITPGTELADVAIAIPLTSVAQGIHTVFIRSKQNPWSLSAFATFNYGGTLPVTWAFVGGEIKNSTAIISWETASEQDAESFLVEHSSDGKNFFAVGNVQAQGNSTSTAAYRFTHGNPSPGLNFYRLKQLDLDGKFSYSKVITLLFKPSTGTAFVAPNPVNELLSIWLPKAQWIGQVSWYDLNGRMLGVKEIQQKTSSVQVNVHTLKRGTYLVKMVGRNETQYFTILKN